MDKEHPEIELDTTAWDQMLEKKTVSNVDTLIYDAKFHRDRYICNPEKNKMCNKRGCFWSGGLPEFNPCFCTSYFDYAVGRYDEMEKMLRDYHDKVVAITKEAFAKNGIKDVGSEKQVDDE